MILLHDLSNNPIIINESFIVEASIHKQFDDYNDGEYSYTKIILNVFGHQLDILETPEEILSIINQNK